MGVNEAMVDYSSPRAAVDAAVVAQRELALPVASMTPAAMAIYAYDQIDQARAELAAVPK